MSEHEDWDKQITGDGEFAFKVKYEALPVEMSLPDIVKLKAPTRHKMSRGKIEDWARESIEPLIEEARKKIPPEILETKRQNIIDTYIFGGELFKNGALKMRHEIRQILPFYNIPQDILEKMCEEIDKIGM